MEFCACYLIASLEKLAKAAFFTRVYHWTHVPNLLTILTAFNANNGHLFFFCFPFLVMKTNSKTAGSRGLTVTSCGCKVEHRFKNNVLMAAIAAAVCNFLERRLHE